jgi:hypothetical protein
MWRWFSGIAWLRLGIDLDISDEAHALARVGADQPLLVAGIRDGLACGIQTACEGGVRNDPASPYGCDHFLLPDDPIAVAHEMYEEIEYLRLDIDKLRPPSKLPTAKIEHMVCEQEPHARRTAHVGDWGKEYCGPSQGKIKTF